MLKNNYAYWYNLHFKDVAVDAPYIDAFCKSCGEGVILEPGSGTGRLASFLKSDRVKFLELSPEMNEVFLRNHPGKKDALMKGSADRIPLPDASVAGIYVPFNGIGELAPVVFTLREFHRVLKADGRLLICAANPDFPIVRAGSGTLPGEGGERFQFDGRTFKTPFGKYSWQTRMSVRTKEGAADFTINQYMMPRETLERLCAAAGFKVESVHGNYDSSPWAPGSPWTLLTLSKAEAAAAVSPKLAATYDAVAPSYDAFVEKGKYAAPAWLAGKLAALDLINPKILDLGCANGNLGKIAAGRFGACELMGLDASPGMIAELKKTALYRHAMVWDLNAGFPFVEAEYFDLAFALGVLEFVADAETLLAGIAETLRPTGTLFCSFELFGGKAGEERAVTDPRIGFARYRQTEDDVAALLRRHKLEAVFSERVTAYTSPSTGERVDYLLLQVKKDRKLP